MTAIRCCRYEKDHTHRSLHDVYYRDSISIPVLSQRCIVQVGIPLKCSIDSNFPAGTTFDVAMSIRQIYRNSRQKPDYDHPGE